MGEVLLDDLTVFISDVYHKIDPIHYPTTDMVQGRPLNWPEDMPEEMLDHLGQGNVGRTATDGNRIVCVNDIFQTSDGRKLRVIDSMGNGTFSYVFKCQLMDEPTKFVALKIIKNLPQYRQTGLFEIGVHRRLQSGPDHPGKGHVMTPLTSFDINNHVCIVMPLLHRSLFEGIAQSQTLPGLLLTVRNIMRQILDALEYVHSIGVYHCDLKPDNLVFSDEDMEHVMMIDFGSAAMDASGVGQYIQSRFYRSPEVILGLPFGCEIDIWSAGCVAAEMYLDFALFACDTEFEVVMSMVALLGAVPDRLITRSPKWQRFFDMTAAGFQPKADPNEILLTKHRYHEIYEQIGAMPLDMLIQEHRPISNDQEREMIMCFIDFVKRLLDYDPLQRLTATQALAHPFLRGEALPPNWAPPRIVRHSHIMIQPQVGRHNTSNTPPAGGTMNKRDDFSFLRGGGAYGDVTNIY